MTSTTAISELVATATGQVHRDDPALPRTGGPAGNARITAWLGIVLLVLFLAELVTLLNVRGLVSWHIGIGALLVLPSLAKTATTGWRIVRYYTGAGPYRTAGPPPLLLRLLGPFVVLTTLALLGSGLATVALGPDSTFAPLVSVAGQRISLLTLHQAAFLAWVVATGLHVLTRTMPAAKLLTGQPSATRVAGARGQTVGLLGTLAIAAITTALVLVLSGAWTASIHR